MSSFPGAAQRRIIYSKLSNIQHIKAWIQPFDKSPSNLPALAISVDWQPTRQIKGIFEIDKNDLLEKTEQEKPPIIEYWYGGHLTYVNDRSNLSQRRQIRRLIRIKDVDRKVVRRKTKQQELERDSKLSYGIEEIAAEIAKKYADADFDPVLVYLLAREETRTFCEYLSQYDFTPKGLSQREAEQRGAFVSYIRDRLGDRHPLYGFVKKGIAYHHSWLPKDVRAELEYAFSRQWIRIMACTTTLIDGVNFPISTFILANYEKVIDTVTDKVGRKQRIVWRLEKKDFQNMIGRAGRAVFDTEGQIVFVIPPRPLSSEVVWQDYLFARTDDPERWVLSSLKRGDFNSQILQDMLSAMEESISDVRALSVDPESLDERYGRGANDVGEMVLRFQAFLLTLMDRDILEPENLQTVNAFISRMLFGQQEPSAELLKLIVRFTQMTGKLIVHAEPSKQRRATYGKSGLGFISCQALYDKAIEYWSDYGRTHYLKETNHISANLLETIGDVVFSLPEIKPGAVRIPHTKPTRILSMAHGHILRDWIASQAPLNSIRSDYFGEIQDIAESTEACANYLRDAFEYKAPWALSAFYIFITKIAETDTDRFNNSPLARQLSMLPAYAKFGVNTSAAAFFSMMGVSVREVSVVLASHYNLQNPQGQFDFTRMIDWLLDLEPEQVLQWFESDIGSDSAGHVPRLFRLLDAIRLQEQVLDEILPLETEIAGWQYYRGTNLISDLRVGDELVLKADPMNPWDSYAVEVYDKQGNKLGLITRTYSRAVHIHLVSDLPLSCKVSDINRVAAFRPVRIVLEAQQL